MFIVHDTVLRDESEYLIELWEDVSIERLLVRSYPGREGVSLDVVE